MIREYSRYYRPILAGIIVIISGDYSFFHQYNVELAGKCA